MQGFYCVDVGKILTCKGVVDDRTEPWLLKVDTADFGRKVISVDGIPAALFTLKLIVATAPFPTFSSSVADMPTAYDIRPCAGSTELINTLGDGPKNDETGALTVTLVNMVGS